MADPAIQTPVSSPNNDWWRRGVRTLLQLLAGGAFAWLTDQLAVDLPAAYVPYVVGGYTVLVTLAQNALEDMGAVKPVLKDRPSGGDGSSTDPMQAAIDAAINAPRSTWATERGKPDNSTV